MHKPFFSDDDYFDNIHGGKPLQDMDLFVPKDEKSHKGAPYMASDVLFWLPLNDCLARKGMLSKTVSSFLIQYYCFSK